MTAVFHVEEATGVDQNIKTVTSVQLLASDTHSTGTELLKANGGLIVYSYERWLRLRFDPPFGKVFNLRFWAADEALHADWDLRYGTTAVYQRPAGGRSIIAIRPLPTSDPGEGAPNVAGLDSGIYGVQEIFEESMSNYSIWIVLQASWSGIEGPADMQSPPLHLTFKWREC